MPHASAAIEEMLVVGIEQLSIRLCSIAQKTIPSGSARAKGCRRGLRSVAAKEEQLRMQALSQRKARDHMRHWYVGRHNCPVTTGEEFGADLPKAQSMKPNMS